MKKKLKKIFFIIIKVLFSMKPEKNNKVADICILKNDISNVFLLKHNDGYIAVDAGSDLGKIEKELKKLNINASEVKHIFLTHTDSDHVACLSLFKNAQVYVSEDEFKMIDGSLKRSVFIKNSLPDKVKTERLVLLKNEELLLGGLKIKCVKTPGHTPGSMTYFIDNKYLFTGDALRINKGTLKRHPFVMDKEPCLNSIQIIKDIIKDSEYVFTAHYGYYKPENLKLA